MSRRTRRLNIPILMTTVLGGGGGFSSQVNPPSGTLYTASADGTFTLELTQPGSTNPFTRIELRYRVQDASNYWTLYIARNSANSAWDLVRARVEAGAATTTVITSGVGTVQALRVTLSGTSHSWFSSADGENFTARGTTTSAVFENATQIGASYTGATGAELYTTANAASISNEANAITGLTGVPTRTVETSDVADGSYALKLQSTSTGSFERGIISLAAFVGMEIIGQVQTKAAVGAASSQRIAWGNIGMVGSVIESITDAYALYSIRGLVQSGADFSGYVTYGVSNSTNVQLNDALSIKVAGVLDDGGVSGPTRLVKS